MIALNRSMIRPYRLIMLIILLGYGIAVYIGIPTYIDIFSVNTILGVTAMICTWEGTDTPNRIFKWLFAIVLLLILYASVPSKFILYISIGMAVFSLVETMAGRPGRLALLSLILMSPLCEYFSNVFGFPIRLQLTKIAGLILHTIDPGYRTEGNVVVHEQAEFSVDIACMGLHMLISSLLCAIILLGIYQRKLGKRLSYLFIILTGVAVLIFNLFSNIVRIIALVMFRIAPENNMHATIGMICFVIYVLLPSIILVKYMVRHFGRNNIVQRGNIAFNAKTIPVQGILLTALICVSVAGKNRSMNEYLPTGTVKASGYKVERLADEIVKLSNARSLIYLKPIIGFYSSDHQPGICWTGSGYKFTELQTATLDGEMIYTSCLEKGTEKIYTAWWYDNGKLKTISQFTWRWNSFRNNQPWVLVNVSANSKQELFNQVRQIRKLNPCRMLLKTN